MGRFNEYDREYGRRDWDETQTQWGARGPNWTGYNPSTRPTRFNQVNRNFGGEYDRGFRSAGTGYDRGYRNFDRFEGGYAPEQHARQPFPVRPAHSSDPMNARRPGYDHGYFGIEYDREMRGGFQGGGYNRGAYGANRGAWGRPETRYDRNFGDFRNSYLGPWF